MKKIFNFFLIGLATSFLMYIFLLPFYLIYVNFKARDIIFFGPISFLLLILLGWVTTNFKISILHYFATFTIKTLSNLYKEFLFQSVKHFYPEKSDVAFKEVVEVEFITGTTVFAFMINKNANSSTVYIPTSPNPTAGFVLKISNSKITPTALTAEEMMEYTISHGVSES